MRRKFFIILPILALTLSAPDMALAQGQPFRDRIVQELTDDGYREIRISRTFLGRLRFLAEKPDARREIVVNPSTGVVLRDFIRFLDEDEDDDDDDDNDGSGGGTGAGLGSGNGSGADDDDGGDSEADDDDDSDDDSDDSDDDDSDDDSDDSDDDDDDSSDRDDD